VVDSEYAYLVELVDSHYDVRSKTGRVVMSCRDEASARHYANLLSEAFDLGFREGYGKARSEL
jgi:hypothetical protein